MAKIINHEHAGLVKQKPTGTKDQLQTLVTQLGCTTVCANSCVCWSWLIMLTKSVISFSHLLLDIQFSSPLASRRHCSLPGGSRVLPKALHAHPYGQLVTLYWPLWGPLPLARHGEEKFPSRSSPTCTEQPDKGRRAERQVGFPARCCLSCSHWQTFGDNFSEIWLPRLSWRQGVPLDLLQLM